MSTILCSRFQKNITVRGMSSKHDGLASVEDIQSTIDKVCSRQIDLDRKLNENKQKKVELQNLHEQQQQMLLNFQLDIEQLSSQFDAEIKDRETLRTK